MIKYIITWIVFIQTPKECENVKCYEWKSLGRTEAIFTGRNEAFKLVGELEKQDSVFMREMKITIDSIN